MPTMYSPSLLLSLLPLISAHTYTYTKVPCPPSTDSQGEDTACFTITPQLPLTTPVFTTTPLGDITDVKMAMVVAPWKQKEYTGGVAMKEDAKRQMIPADYHQETANSNLTETQTKNQSMPTIYKSLDPYFDGIYQMRHSWFLPGNRRLFSRIASAAEEQSAWWTRVVNTVTFKDFFIARSATEEPLLWALAALKINTKDRKKRDDTWKATESQKHVCALKSVEYEEVVNAYDSRVAELFGSTAGSERKDLLDKASKALRMLSMPDKQYTRYASNADFKYAKELQHWIQKA